MLQRKCKRKNCVFCFITFAIRHIHFCVVSHILSIYVPLNCDLNDSFRWEYLQSKTLKTLNVKVDKWNKMAQNEEQKVVIQDFLDKLEVFAVIIYATPAGQLLPSYEFPTSIKQKGGYNVLMLFQ